MNKDDWADRIKELLWEAASAGRSGDNGTEIEFLFDKLMVAVKQLCAEAREQERLRTLEQVRIRRKQIDPHRETDERRYPHGYNQAVSDLEALIAKLKEESGK